MMTNQPNGVLYIGVTSDLIQRTSQHRAGEIAGSSPKKTQTGMIYMRAFSDRHGWEEMPAFAGMTEGL